MKLNKSNPLQKMISILVVFCIVFSLASSAFAITIQDEVVWFFDLMDNQSQALRQDVVELIAGQSGSSYVLDTAGALSDANIDVTVADILASGITPVPSAAAMKTGLQKLSELNTQDPQLMTALLTQLVQSADAVLDVTQMMKKFMDILARQNQTTRQAIVNLIATKSGSTYNLDTSANGKLSDANYNSTVDAIINELTNTGTSEASKRIIVEVGLYGLMKFNNDNSGGAITSYILTQFTEKLVDVTTPDGLGSILTRIESYTISYRNFVNILFKISGINGNKPILIYEKNKSGNIIEDPMVPTLFNLMIGIVNGNAAETAKLTEFKTKIEQLLASTNSSPAAEKQVLVNDLQAKGLLVVDESTNGNGGNPGGNPGGGGGVPGGGSNEVIVDDEETPGGALSQEQVKQKIEDAFDELTELILQHKNDKTEADSSKTAAAITEALQDADANLQLLEDKKLLLDKAASILSLATGTINQLEKQNISTDGVRESLAALAQNALDRLAAVTVDTGSKNSAFTLTGSALEAVTAAMGEAKSFTARLNAALAGLDEPLNMQTVFSINTSGSAITSFEAPASLLTAAAAANIDNLSLNLGTAQFTFAANAFPVTAGSTFTISAEELDKDQIVPPLSATAKAAIGDHPVYSFKAVSEGKAILFKGKVTVSISTEDENANTMTAYTIDEQGVLQNLGGFYNETDGTYIFSTEHFSNFFLKVNSVAFTDVTAKHWAYDSISAMAAKGIVNGIGNKKFNPEGSITRADFITMVLRTIRPDSKSLSDAKFTFTDVSKTKLYYNDIVTAVKAGIITDTSAKFRPEAAITRQEAAVFLGRALAKYKGEVLPKKPAAAFVKFGDKSSITGNDTGYIALTVRRGLIAGITGGKFAPNANMTRAQAATILLRYLKAE